MQLDPNNDSSNPLLRDPVLQIFIAQGDTVLKINCQVQFSNITAMASMLGSTHNHPEKIVNVVYIMDIVHTGGHSKEPRIKFHLKPSFTKRPTNY